MEEEKLRALANAIAVSVTAIDRAEHQLLGLLREFDKLDGWQLDGATSFAAWLSWRCGMSPGTARERVRVAAALADLPLIDSAFANGEISYSKARAVTRVARAENEEVLLASARGMSAAELEKLCQMVRNADDEDDRSEPAEPKRSFAQRARPSGMVEFSVTVTADEAAVVCAALDAAAPAPNRRAEGLVAIADQACRGTSSARNPTEVVVRIEACDLSGTTADGAGVPAETARRLLCDAGVVPVLCDETGRTLDVGRKTRTIPAAIRRALSLRDDGCRFPGCRNRIVDGHHIRHWIDEGKTALENLVSLCRRHHRLLHEGGTSIRREGDDQLVFRNRNGDVLAPAPAPMPAAAVPVEINVGDPWAALPTDSLRPIDWHSVAAAVLDVQGE